MNRREFLRGAGACAAVAWSARSTVWGAPSRPEVSITMDDFSFAETPLFSPSDRNAKILAALAAHEIHAAAFVVGKNAEPDANRALLALWAKGGHTIGNH